MTSTVAVAGAGMKLCCGSQKIMRHAGSAMVITGLAIPFLLEHLILSF